MRRPLLTLTALLAATIAAAAPSASAAIDRCRPRSGEHTLARSAQAVVLERIVRQTQHFPLQTIVGCSRRSGKRRVLDTLQRRSVDDATKLIGLKLAGTRVAYVLVLNTYMARTTIVAEDATHGGRRHDLGTGWPDGLPFGFGAGDAIAWAVDAHGDVAWVRTASDAGYVPGPQALGVWRPGLGRRLVDSHADLRGLRLDNGMLGWRRNGKPRRVDLTALPPSRCVGLGPNTGTLDVDLVWGSDVAGPFSACLRATGLTVAASIYNGSLADANGPYLLFRSAWRVGYGSVLLDLRSGTVTGDGSLGGSPVVTDNGSIAWLNDGLWVRDAAGTRKVAEAGAGTGPLLRDGSTVTWSGGGPTVTLSP